MTHSLFIPIVANGTAISPQGEPLPVARQIFLMMKLHPEQGRSHVVWEDRLAVAAAEKCYRQAHEGWSGHIDPQGHGPNWMVKQAGYLLPDWYGQADDANNIESLSHNGDGRPDLMWMGLLDSPGHRIHVLGLNPFYAAQTQVGIGYYHLETSPKRHYWCLLSAPPEGDAG